MLSKKTAVSLTSLAIIVALAFMGPVAMGAEFNVWVDTSEDKSAAPGLQLLYPSTDNILKVIVYFDQAVELQTSHVEISGFDATGTYDPAIVLVPPAQYPIYPEGAHTAFWVRIAVTPGTSKVSLRVAGGIPSDDPLNADTSKEFTAEIGVLSVGGPRVHSIRRADNSTLPLTGGPVNVIITLSEQPEKLDASHINVTNATTSTPVFLGLLARSSPPIIEPRPLLRTVSQLREVIKDYMNNDVPRDFDGFFIFSHPSPRKSDPPAEFIEAVRALRTAVNNIGSPWNYYFLYANGLLTYTTLWKGPGTDYELFPLVNSSVPMPRMHGTADLTDKPPPANLTIEKEQFNRSAAEPPPPKAADYATQAEFDSVVLLHKVLSGSDADAQRAAYQRELMAYEKYMALQKALQAHDIRKQQEWDQIFTPPDAPVRVDPQDSLLSTGRDGMLHPYLVTLTPEYANADPIVVKVHRWANTAVPPSYYNPPALEIGYIEGFNKLTIPVFETPGIVPPGVPETEATRFPADVNGDGVVNIQDLVFVSSNFGKTGQHPADVNGDGVVSILDLVLVASAFGEGAAAAAP